MVSGRDRSASPRVIMRVLPLPGPELITSNNAVAKRLQIDAHYLSCRIFTHVIYLTTYLPTCILLDLIKIFP